MNFYIIIPVHNEEKYISQTLQSIVNQILKPKKLVVVNDNSSDNTGLIINDFVKRFDWIQKVENKSSNFHLPGSKTINAFYAGYEILDEDYDVLCKFDGDLIFEPNYLSSLKVNFENNPRLGMFGGVCYIKKENNWILENLSQNNHIRGALKAYRKECFFQVGKLRRAIGWDTLDELLAQYYQWEVLVDGSLKVKHLKPTGFNYSKGSTLLQGEAIYRMRLGRLLTLIIAIKRGMVVQSFGAFWSYLKGYSIAKKNKTPFTVDQLQGKFIRKYRWRMILRRIKPK